MPDETHCFYSAFGLSLRSNAPIPGLVSSGKNAPTSDVEIHLAVRPDDSDESDAALEELYYVSSQKDEHGEPAFRIWRTADSKYLRMDYVDGVRFWFDRGAKNLWSTWPENFTIADASVYLLGPILGVLLRLRGVTCLHASAAAFGDHAVAFAGPEGAGKSTTATALGRRGHAIISDDIVAVEERDGGFFVSPAHPYVCLWPESIEMLYGREKSVPAFASSWEKGRLSLAENDLRFQEQALPLGAICLLGERSSDAAAPFIEIAPSRENLFALIANSYGTNLLENEMRAREFELLGRLVARVPVWRLRPNQDGSKIEGLCELIEARVANLGVPR